MNKGKKQECSLHQNTGSVANNQMLGVRKSHHQALAWLVTVVLQHSVLSVSFTTCNLVVTGSKIKILNIHDLNKNLLDMIEMNNTRMFIDIVFNFF